MLPEIERRGADLVVIASGAPHAIGDFRSITGFAGPLMVDPSLRAYDAAGLVRGLRTILDPRGVARVLAALVRGFLPGAVRGSAVQQGGTFVVGPGDRVHFAWRDRFSGDHAAMRDVLAAIPAEKFTPG